MECFHFVFPVKCDLFHSLDFHIFSKILMHCSYHFLKPQLSFRTIKNKKNRLLHVLFILLWCFFLLYVDPTFSLKIFFRLKSICYYVFEGISADNETTNSLRFCLSEKAFISSLLLKDIFASYRILIWKDFFFLSTFHWVSFYCLPAYMVSGVKSSVILYLCS